MWDVCRKALEVPQTPSVITLALQGDLNKTRMTEAGRRAVNQGVTSYPCRSANLCGAEAEGGLQAGGPPSMHQTLRETKVNAGSSEMPPKKL